MTQRTVRVVRSVVVMIAVMIGAMLGWVRTEAAWHRAANQIHRAAPARLDGVDPVRLIVEQPTGVIRGHGPPDSEEREAHVSLHAPGGHVRATGAVRIWSGTDSWRLDLQDGDGQPVVPRSGDRIEARIGSRTIELTVPPLALRFDRGAGIVAGRTVPGATVNVTATEHSAFRRVGADGAFVAHLGGPLFGNRPVEVEVTLGSGHRLRLTRLVPWTRISIRPGEVIGAAGPEALVRATLLGADGVRRASGRALADRRGRWALWLRDERGRRVRPRGGDELVVVDPEGARRLVVADPAMKFEETGVITGLGEASDLIEAYLWSPWHPGRDEVVTTTVRDDGTWTIRPARPPDAGTHVYLTAEVAHGDQIFDCHQLPALHVSVGTPIVDIEALYDVDARLALVREGRRIGTADVTSRWSGSVEARLRPIDADTPTGEPLRMTAGDVLVGRLDGRDVRLEIPPLDAELSGVPVRLHGRTIPGTQVGLADGADALPETATADDQGTFSFPLGERTVGRALRPGARVAAFVRLADGHTAQKGFVGPHLNVLLSERRHWVHASAGLALTITHDSSHAATETRHVVARAERATPFQLTRALQPGDEITIDDGGTFARLEVPRITGHFDPESMQAFGRAEPYSPVVVELDLFDEGLPLTWSTLAGENGHWSVRMAAQPGSHALLGLPSSQVPAPTIRQSRPDSEVLGGVSAPHTVAVTATWIHERDVGRTSWLPWAGGGP